MCKEGREQQRGGISFPTSRIQFSCNKLPQTGLLTLVQLPRPLHQAIKWSLMVLYDSRLKPPYNSMALPGGWGRKVQAPTDMARIACPKVPILQRQSGEVWDPQSAPFPGYWLSCWAPTAITMSNKSRIQARRARLLSGFYCFDAIMGELYQQNCIALRRRSMMDGMERFALTGGWPPPSFPMGIIVERLE